MRKSALFIHETGVIVRPMMTTGHIATLARPLGAALPLGLLLLTRL
ncbi:hypothetical protein SAMN05444413_112100 [Roseivivax marinus]|jgi:hypothetical protein|nr:hypothetical protein SAMN05444413_112100 [Roseivivax marinus]